MIKVTYKPELDTDTTEHELYREFNTGSRIIRVDNKGIFVDEATLVVLQSFSTFSSPAFEIEYNTTPESTEEQQTDQAVETTETPLDSEVK